MLGKALYCLAVDVEPQRWRNGRTLTCLFAERLACLAASACHVCDFDMHVGPDVGPNE